VHSASCSALCIISTEQAVGIYREKESRSLLSPQQGEVANTNARSDAGSVYTNNIKVSWISTNNQAVEGLTKAFNRVEFARFEELIRVVD
jgi:hypothetical protein